MTSRMTSVDSRAELQAEAAAFERIHRRRAPGAVERLAGSADHRAAAVAAADAHGDLRHRRNDDDAFGLVEQLLRDVVGDVEDLLHDDAGILQARLFLVGGTERHGTQHDAQYQTERNATWMDL